MITLVLKCVLVCSVLGINLDISLLCDLIQTYIAISSLKRGISMKLSISNLVVNGAVGVTIELFILITERTK